MALRVVKIYIFLVLILVSILPTIYFILPAYEVTDKQKPTSYVGDYYFIQSHDEYELFARTLISHDTLPTLIFLADIPSRANLAFEEFLADSLVGKANLVFPDYRAAGKSERFKSFSAYNLLNYVEDLKTITRELKLKNVVLVGHAFGGLIAKLAENDSSELFDKLILVNPTQNFDESAKRVAADLANHFKNMENEDEQVPFYYEMYGYSLEEKIGFFGAAKIFASMDYYKTWFVDTLKAEFVSVEHVQKSAIYSFEEASATHLPSTTIGLMYSLFRTPYEWAFQEFKLPSLILAGEADKFTDESFFKAKADSLDNVRYETIAKSGHFPYIENPDQFLEKIIEFINE